MDTAGSGEPEGQLEKGDRSHDWHTKQEGLRYFKHINFKVPQNQNSGGKLVNLIS